MKIKIQTKEQNKIKTRTRLSIAAACLLCLCACLPARAVMVGWHDQKCLQLGKGVDLKRQQEPQPQIAIMDTNAAIVLNSGGQSESVTFAQHTYDMVRSLSVNSSVSLSSLVFSGSAKVNFFSQQTFDANDLNK